MKMVGRSVTSYLWASVINLHNFRCMFMNYHHIVTCILEKVSAEHNRRGLFGE